MKSNDRKIKFKERLGSLLECFGGREDGASDDSDTYTHTYGQVSLARPLTRLDYPRPRSRSPSTRQGALKMIGGHAHGDKKPGKAPIPRFGPVSNTNAATSSQDGGTAHSRKRTLGPPKSTDLEDSLMNESGLASYHNREAQKIFPDLVHLADTFVTNSNGRTLSVQYSQSWDLPLGQLGHNLTCAEGETYTLPYLQRRQRTPMDPLQRIQELNSDEGKSRTHYLAFYRSFR